MESTDNIVERVLATGGGAVAISKSLSASGKRISSQAVGQWSRVPAERVLEVEAITGISRHELRPDVYGPEPLPSEDQQGEHADA